MSVTAILKYSKAIVAVLGAVATAVEVQFPATDHWIPVLNAFFTAFLVYVVPNASSQPANPPVNHVKGSVT